MQRVKAPRKSAQRTIIYLSFFLLLSIPLVVFGLSNGNFDIRNRAFDDLEVSEENPCIISIPNVNPYTLEIGKTVTVQIDAKLSDSIISELNITNSSGESIYNEKFQNSPIEIATSFKFSPNKSGVVDMLGIIKKENGGSIGCKISSPYDILGIRAIANNNSPEFISLTSNSKPSQDIKTGTIYEYTMKAIDDDGDRINYSYSFTPNNDWLKPSIIEDGSSGKLTIKFTGSTNNPASYLANVFIHDGYSMHLRSQSWVINVSPAKNDIPIIKITNPTESLRISKGNKFNVAWEANDLNYITKYQLFIANNPTNESSWIAIDTDISFKTRTFNVPTSNLEPGTYRVIIKALDNQVPQAWGLALSQEIVITDNGGTIPQDDLPILAVPQVINMTPISTDEITNKRVTVKASLLSSNSAEISENSIIFKIDGEDKTSEIKINKISKEEYTIIYQPTSDFSGGIHKAEITFSDTKGQEVKKEWTFTIQQEVKESEEEMVSVFGLDINKRILMIVGIGLLVVVLAIVAPIIIFNVWREDKKRNQDEPYTNNLESKIKDNPLDFPLVPQESEITQKVQSEEQEVPQDGETEDKWDNFSAPKPTEQKEEIPNEIIEPEISQEPPIEQPLPVEEMPKQEVPEPAQEPLDSKTTVPNILPPEPDLTTELPTQDDLKEILGQIQEVQNKPPETNS